MTRRGWMMLLGVLVLTACVIGASVIGLQIHIGPVIAVCRTDDEIAAPDRQALDTAATAFVAAVLKSDPKRAYATMSTAGHAAATQAQFETVAKGLQAARSIGPPSVHRTYEIEGITGDSPATRGSCDEPGSAGGPTFVSIGGGGGKQGHVLVVDPLDNAKRTFDVWMTSEGGSWRVNGFYGQLSEIAGRDGEALWAEAKAQRTRGHAFNATLLYAVASQTLSRGPNLQLSVAPAFQKDIGSFTQAAELKGPPPFHWTLNGQAFVVSNVTYSGVNDGKVVLVINQAPAPWKGERDADQRNHRLIDAFMATHPEWLETFDAITARSPTEEPNTSFGSVYERGLGYHPQKLSD